MNLSLPGPWPVVFSARFNRPVIFWRACRQSWMSEEIQKLLSFSPVKTLRIFRICSLEVHKGFSPVYLGPHNVEYMFTLQEANGSSREWIHTTSVCMYLIFYFVLEYSWLTMLWCFQVDSKGTQPYIYLYPFSPPNPPSHPGCHVTLRRVPCANSRSLLVILCSVDSCSFLMGSSHLPCD